MQAGEASLTQDLRIAEIRGPEGRERLSALLDAAFGVPEGSHFLQDFPVWDERFGPRAPYASRLGAFDGPRLAGSACVRVARMQVAGPGGAAATYPVALIGAVATDPAYRARGLASRLVEEAVEWARKRGAAAALLWGSEHALYRRLGFELCGEQVGIPLASLRLPQPCAFSRGWTPALAAKLRSGGSGLAFEESDLGWLSAHRNVDWFRAGDADSPSAYAAVGRGIDLQGYVHEWGGEPAALHALLARVKQIYPEAILLGGPEALAQAGFAPGGGPRDFLCMARILDPARIFSARHGIQLEAKLTDGAWSLRGPGFGLNGLSPSELSRLFFGPLGPEESEAAAPLFPIPLWVWGLDAV